MSWFCSSVLLNKFFLLKSCRHAFDHGFFHACVFYTSQTSIRSTVITGQTEGLKGGFKEWVGGGFMADSWRIHGGFMADSWRMGLQKLITVLDRFHTYKGGA